MNVFPVWVALLSWPVLGEPISRSTWMAIAVGLAGVVLVESPHLAFDPATVERELLPAMVALTGSFSTAIAMLGLHRLQNVDPRAVVVHFSGVALAALVAMLALVPNDALRTSRFDTTALAMLLGVGTCATAGQISLTRAFTTGPPAKVSVVALSQAAFAMLFDVFVTGHRFGVVTLAGMGLIMAPTAWLLLSQGRAQVEDL
jgi:drug/metabolite transporter (DMT)-like permease